jgi:hypothetical protein
MSTRWVVKTNTFGEPAVRFEPGLSFNRYPIEIPAKPVGVNTGRDD